MHVRKRAGVFHVKMFHVKMQVRRDGLVGENTNWSASVTK